MKVIKEKMLLNPARQAVLCYLNGYLMILTSTYEISPCGETFVPRVTKWVFDPGPGEKIPDIAESDAMKMFEALK